MTEQLNLVDISSIQKLSIKQYDGVNTIYWYEHRPLYSYREDNDILKRMAIVFLIESKLASYDEVASLLEYSKSNLYVIIKAFREKGILGLVKKKTGPKDAKVTPEIQQFILKTKGLTLNEMVDLIQEKFGTPLSDWTVSAVKRGEIHSEQTGLFPDDFLDSLLTDENPENEVSKSEQTCMETVENPAYEQVQVEESSHIEGAPSRQLPKTDIQPVTSIHSAEESKEEKNTMDSRYAGGFLLLPFVQQIDPVGLYQRARETYGKVLDWDSKEYDLSNFITTLIFLLWFRFSSIEDFKFVQPREFGVLLDKNGAPSVKTLRRYFPDIQDGEITEEWMLQLVRRYIQLDVIQLGTLYFDGHKIPYYGHVDLPKGYLSSKRFPAKLIEQVFANDRSGRPVFLRVHDTSLSFKDTVLSMIEDAQDLWKERERRAPLVVAFDRELYDTTFFKKLDEMGVLFITWRKYDKPVKLEQLTETIYSDTKEETATEEIPVKYRAWRREITVQGYEIEAISFLSEEKSRKDPDRTPSTLVTNASKFPKTKYPDFDPPSTGDIIDTLCGRWRQENYFRYSKHGQGLDYNPEYRTGERQESLTQANPLIKQLKQEKAKLRKEVDKLNDKIASRITKRKKKDRPLGDILEQKSMQKLRRQKEESENRIQAIRKKLSTLPERVSKEKTEETSLELQLEGKRFLDVLRIVMHNAEQMLLDIFKRCYVDPRDTHKVLHAIANQGGTVEERSDAFIVELKPLHIPAHQRATERLCQELNAEGPNLAPNGKKIIFKVRI